MTNKQKGLVRKNFGKNFGGFGHLETFLVIVVAVVIAAMGVWVYQRNHKDSNTTVSNQVQIAGAPDVNSVSDLDKASDTLEQTTGANDSGDIDKLAQEVDSL